MTATTASDGEGRPSRRIALAIRNDVLRVSAGQPTRWVAVHDIADRLALDDDIVEAAVGQAVADGWFIAEGTPPRSVRLSVV